MPLTNCRQNCPSQLANAILSDNAEAVVRCIQQCNLLDKSELFKQTFCTTTACQDEEQLKLTDILISSILKDHSKIISSIDTSALLVSARMGSVCVVTRLLEADIKVDFAHRNQYAIRLACRNGHLSVVQVLLADHRVNSCGLTDAVRSACVNGHFEIVKLLFFDPRVDPSLNDNSAVRTASANGQFEIVRLLLTDSRVDPSASNNDAIRLASSEGNVEIARLLMVDPRVNASVMGQDALIQATRMGNVDVVDLLLSDARVLVTKTVLRHVDQRASSHLALGKSSTESLSRVQAVRALLRAQSLVWHGLIDVDFMLYHDGPLHQALEQIKGECSLVMLLSVKRQCTPTVAARMNDVLRDVCQEWICCGAKLLKI